ncbi:CAP domain-containing protein [Lysinibacillus telephonicus]|uniref:CAP domain-containing protein n=1 Tax=Lysinibacillus telephonicus TaxID=1714840 RepID=UPI0031FDC4B0
MNKKWLATSLCAATLFGASFTTAGATGLNEEVKSDSNSYIQVIKGDQVQGIALKIIDQIALQNGEFDFNKFKELVNKSLNNQAAQKVIKEGKKVYQNNASKETNTEAPAKSTNVTNNNKTTAPTNSNNQQVEAPAKTPSTNVSQSVSEFEKQVVDLTNAERAKAGLKPLQISNPLMNVAQAKSEDMAKNNYFSHTSPTYGSPFDQIKAAGISYRSAGENIAQGQRTPEEVVQAWMNSEGHRANILNGNYTHIGVGYVADGNYWTQQFIQQ